VAQALLRAFDPLIIHATEAILSRRASTKPLSFGRSLAGARDILLVTARELIDLLAVVPAARALRKRFPLARIHVLASERCGEILAPRREVFEVISWSAEEPLLSREYLQRIRAMRRRPFDLAVAVDSGDARRGRVTAALSGAKLRLGMHPDGVDPTLNLVIAASVEEGYRPVQSLQFLSFLGIPREDLAPSWDIPKPDKDYADRLLELRRRGSDGWLLGVDPGPGLAGVRPSPRKLAWLVERIVAARGAVPIVLTEDPDEPGVQAFRACLKGRTLEVASRGICDVLSFTKCCDMFISGNTNLFHFAVGLDVPALGLFGQEDEDRWIPRGRKSCRTVTWGPGTRVVESDVLRQVDAARGAGMGDIPLRIMLADDVGDDTEARSTDAPGNEAPAAGTPGG
jgi:ADP-heptose:LPS heptosyltransferase